MIRSDHYWKRTLCCFCILFQIYTVAEGRRYDKCTTEDGRQGVCVVKRFCREATTQTLLPCDDKEEIHCCPIPTTLRSASKQPERPRTAPDDKDGGGPRGIDRDDRLNKTPPPGDRRSPTRHSNERPKKQSDGDRTNNSSNRPQGYPREEPLENREHRPPTRHSSERPKKQSDGDRTNDDRNSSNRPQGYPREEPSENRGHRDEDEHRPPPSRATSHDNSDPPRRRPVPTQDRFYPAKEKLLPDDDRHPPRHSKPGRNSPKNRTRDSSNSPIRFPESYEFSVPRPKVPACGVKPYEMFIAGGQESQAHEWPWMTAIFRRYPDSRPKTFLCGGSLINTKYVLTAAHCFVNNYVILPASSFVVRLGSHFLDSGEEYTVSNLVIHHNHSGSDFFNDIALVHLASEVYVTDKIAPICLPFPEMMSDNFVGRMATVAGWGDTAFRTGGSRILQHVTVPIVSGEECFAAYSRVRGAAFLARGSDHVICAGLREGGKDACLGDSGGPLMLKMTDDRWIIVGIVSLGYKCAEPGYPGVYTRVTHYISWINTNMKKY